MKATIDDSPFLPRETPPVSVDEVTEAWERVFGRSPIPPDANFFDLGGNPLIASLLIAEVEALVGCRLSTDLVFETMTIRNMALILKDGGHARSSVLVRMNAGGGGPPLFFFPGSPGSLMQLAPLAGWIRRPVPIYGVKPRGAYVGESPYERIEDLAEYAIDEIKLTAKGGPYLLVGYSAGGLVAFEIARRLSSAGASIPLLALLDTYPSEATWPIACHFEVFARQLSYRLEELQAHPPSEIKSYIRERVRGLLAYFWRSGWGRRAWQRPAPQILLQEEQRLHDATVAAALRYRPGYYGGKITFFRPREIGMRPGDPRRVWRKFAREVEIHMVSGSHGSMMDPHVETLATPLCLCLETALGGPFTSLCDTSYGA